jgi:hypothetical protein
MIATIVDWDALLKVVVASLVAGIGVTTTFSLAILGATRLTDARRDERRRDVVVFSAVGGACLALTLAAVIVGIVVMTSK